MDREQAIGHMRLQLNGVFVPFSKYGQDIYIPKAIEAIITLSLQLHEVLNGKDIPIVLKEDFGADD